MTRQERTAKLIETFRGIHDEWSMLKGVLCMTNGFFCESRKDHDLIDSIFDSAMIVERMDEIVMAVRVAA